MAADEIRTGAYRDALQRTVTPKSVVVDIGAGSGILSLLSCQAGARKVYAIEPDDAIHVARELAKANGFEDRIEFVQEISTGVSLPEKADIIVFDLNGYLPFCAGSLPAIIHAREQFLGPNGVFVPQGADIVGTIVQSKEHYDWCVSCSRDRPYGLEFEPIRRYLVNTSANGGSIRPENFLVKPAKLLSLSYQALSSANASGCATWTIEVDGMAHGLCVWFESFLTQDVRLSNAPDQPALVYSRKFLPLNKPVSVEAGDRVCVEFYADYAAGDYAFRWNTIVHDAQSRKKIDFRQGSMLGIPKQALAQDLASRSAAFVPSSNETVEIDRMILNAVDGHRTTREIAEALSASYPQTFPHWQTAFERARQLLAKYARPSTDKA